MPRTTLRRVLVTGASGQLGSALVPALAHAGYRVRALVHRNKLSVRGVECVAGDVSDPASVRAAMAGVDAVCHLATTKEDPDGFIDVSVRGTYNLLEAARHAGTVRRWILAGGDAAMGIYYREQPVPLNERMPHNAYPGVYALSKVLEEVLGQQFFIQYGLPCICLRASWILHGDMILRHMSARSWMNRMTPAQRRALHAADRVAILSHRGGRPLIRHVVGLNDVVAAFLLALKTPQRSVIGQTFHIAGPSPFSYEDAANHLARKLKTQTMKIVIPEAHDFSIDISKARRVLGYRPKMGIRQIIDAALHRSSMT